MIALLITEQELSTLNATLKEQIARNENLKRIKVSSVAFHCILFLFPQQKYLSSSVKLKIYSILQHDLNLQHTKNSSLMPGLLEKAICSKPQQRESSPNNISSMLHTHVQGDDNTMSDSCETQDAISNHDRSFLLPDLNMMPSEDTLSETPPGMR